MASNPTMVLDDDFMSFLNLDNSTDSTVVAPLDNGFQPPPDFTSFGKTVQLSDIAETLQSILSVLARLEQQYQEQAAILSEVEREVKALKQDDCLSYDSLESDEDTTDEDDEESDEDDGDDTESDDGDFIG